MRRVLLVIAVAIAVAVGFSVSTLRATVARGAEEFAQSFAEQEGVEIRTYEIIYDVIEDIEAAVIGMLEPEFEEVVTGEAEVREVFRIKGVGLVSASVLRAFIGRFDRFGNGKQLARFCAMTPRNSSSATS